MVLVKVGLSYVPQSPRGTNSYGSVDRELLKSGNGNADSTAPIPWHSASSVLAISQGFWSFELEDLTDDIHQLDRSLGLGLSRNRETQNVTHPLPIGLTHDGVHKTRRKQSKNQKKQAGFLHAGAEGYGGEQEENSGLHCILN